MNRKGLLLLSGGLDSVLAAKILLRQGVELEAINFASVFYQPRKNSAKNWPEATAAELGIKLTTVNITENHVEIVKNPRHGYGSNMNPCIDCRIYMYGLAGEHAKKIGAEFIATGEVLGERPMSQRRATMELIEKEAGLNGLIVRPLSAKLMAPSLPEKRGIVDRDKLFDIQGRSRKPQMELAAGFGITAYQTPAGGCLLTDINFAKRVRDLLSHGEFTVQNIRTLKLGRHFRLGFKTRLIVGRNRDENENLLGMAEPGDTLFDAKNVPSPIALLRAQTPTKEDVDKSCSILARYSDLKSAETEIIYWRHPKKTINESIAVPTAEKLLKNLRI